MNALVKKEIRLIQPAFVGALVLAIVPVWVLPDASFDGTDGGLVAFLFLFGIVLLALSSFGREFSLKTLPFIVAQPLERARLWRTKILVLGCFVALASSLWFLSARLCFAIQPAHLVRLEVLVQSGLVVTALTAGGLWMTLLLRQTIAAFWLTILIPMAMLIAITEMGGTEWLGFAALAIYAVAGFFLARRKFLHLQDTAWTGGVISFGRARSVGAQGTLREHRPRAALVLKELQLQQVTLIGMGCLVVLHLGTVLLRKAEANVFSKMTLAALEMFPLLWFIVPMVAGSLTVADERQLGTLDALLCLPVSRRRQFVVKLLLALTLGLMSAVAMCAIEQVANALGVGERFDMMGFTAAVFVFLALSMVGLYASTLTRGLVSALAAGVAASAVICGLCSMAVLYSGFMLWFLVAIPILAAAFIWLAYGNFRYVFEDKRRWSRNIVVLACFMVVITAAPAAVYHRVWEWAMPLEDAHGAARLPVGKAALIRGGPAGGLAVVLPDGRLWVDRSAFIPRSFQQGSRSFVAGSNWVDAFQNVCETAAIRSDGTLWVSEKPQRRAEDPLSPLIQFGAETNWQSLALDTMSSMFLLKRDGTLWHWGTNQFDERMFWMELAANFRSNRYAGLRASVPLQLGADSDWVRILRGNKWTYAWKRDGRAWGLHDFEPKPERRRLSLEFAQGIVAERVPDFDRVQFQSLNVSDTAFPIEVGIRTGGSLWYWNWWVAEHPEVKPRSNEVLSRGLVQIGKDSNWAAVAGGLWCLVALKTDGSIWKWNLIEEGRRSLEALQDLPERLGTHSDWIGLSYWRGNSVFLAADGTLRSWSVSGQPSGWSQSYRAPSRRPAKIANILGVDE